jgi:hypothetical protein
MVVLTKSCYLVFLQAPVATTTTSHSNTRWDEGFFGLIRVCIDDEDEDAFFEGMYEYVMHAGKAFE